MAGNCAKCGKEIGFFSTIAVHGKDYCFECSNSVKTELKSDDYYSPDIPSIKRALSVLLTQQKDTQKLFDSGEETNFKLFGGDINNFINLNANLVSAAILMKILEKLENIEKKIVSAD